MHAHAFIQPPSSSIESNSTGNTVLPSLHCQLLHSRKISCKTYEVLSYLTLIPHLTARNTHPIFRLQCQQWGFFKAAAAVSRASRRAWKQNISASFISSKKPAAVSAADRSTLQAVTNILYRKLSLTAVRLIPPRPTPSSSSFVLLALLLLAVSALKPAMGRLRPRKHCADEDGVLFSPLWWPCCVFLEI